MKHFDLVFGAMSPPISEQLDAAGVSYDAEAISKLEADVKAAIRLRVRGLARESEYARICNALARQVKAATLLHP